MSRLHNFIVNKLWYGQSLVRFLLIPFSFLFALVVAIRRYAYRIGLLKSSKPDVPVIVVGNITVGGTGKTQTVLAIVDYLLKKGFKPGIITRGFGGKTHEPTLVDDDSDVARVGDEAYLLYQRSKCPVSVGSDRVACAHQLVLHRSCDVIVSDDGLQHYGLKRDIEVVLIDGDRGLGNGYLLPAGPLRELPRRLREATLVLSKHKPHALAEAHFTVSPNHWVNLKDGSEEPLNDFAYQDVQALAGIANPQAFFDTLTGLGLRHTAHSFPDHAAFEPQHLAFASDLPLVMTEKDAVKCRAWACADWWYLKVDADMPAVLWTVLEEKL